jgi:hypothetical protein
MRTLLIGLTILASTFLVSPGKSERPVVQPAPEAVHCPLTCGQEVTCADGRVFCNCCLAKQAGEKNCSGCRF